MKHMNYSMECAELTLYIKLSPNSSGVRGFVLQLKRGKGMGWDGMGCLRVRVRVREEEEGKIK